MGSFTWNRHGLYDMGGNVWEWCEDWYDNGWKYRVLRGASWGNCGPRLLLSSRRCIGSPDVRLGDIGFRCVLVCGSAAR
ncbi:MAG: formylglycine-generating enzyme family protein [Verrucomicrobia bacterium]|nr:formylglycine-generating enzyme family protein [Verrucomicrobiota bacterium]